MPANVEIKARVSDPERLRAKVVAGGGAFQAEIPQEDTFFPVPQGRLKLRVAPHRAELIHYERPDAAGPRTSRYALHPVAQPESLKAVLEAALGIRGVVRKRRRLYLLGQTRIHLDEVEALGAFLELEVVLRPGQTQPEGERIARDLMATLGVVEEDLIAGAYIDLLDAGEGEGHGRDR